MKVRASIVLSCGHVLARRRRLVYRRRGRSVFCPRCGEARRLVDYEVVPS